jgi:hypothetical protein
MSNGPEGRLLTCMWVIRARSLFVLFSGTRSWRWGPWADADPIGHYARPQFPLGAPFTRPLNGPAQHSHKSIGQDDAISNTH